MSLAIQWLKRIIFGLIGLIILILILTIIFGWLILLVPIVLLLIAIGILLRFFRKARGIGKTQEKGRKGKEYIDVEYTELKK